MNKQTQVDYHLSWITLPEMKKGWQFGNKPAMEKMVTPKSAIVMFKNMVLLLLLVQDVQDVQEYCLAPGSSGIEQWELLMRSICAGKDSQNRIYNFRFLSMKNTFHFLFRIPERLVKMVNDLTLKSLFILFYLNSFYFFIGPESDHWECLSVTNWLTHWLTPV